MNVTDHTVAFVLRVIGAIDLLALGAAVMPLAWMQGLHTWLGLGEMPPAPIVEYLARSTSVFYAVHAATLLYLSTDVARFRPVIRFLAWLAILHGVLLMWLDLRSGMPRWWAFAESGGAAFEGVLILSLLGFARRTVINNSVHTDPALGNGDIAAKEL